MHSDAEKAIGQTLVDWHRQQARVTTLCSVEDCFDAATLPYFPSPDAAPTAAYCWSHADRYPDSLRTTTVMLRMYKRWAERGLAA